ncbi:hypothetical protein CSB45_04195 [candidate division KSB3 bacterium]|uniref:Uncharacterized protein n=1 Tax=candidate division KSB3 bacterium TaxID=2044937 RepID=A0A2G6E875_9BACT|nr:MAG: hypothetical protein CSB45_04195 [candidate division KSB3 bacterium]PIE30580.1 MAG: hypothetical protein CSA57_02780 [candidate division KSB3 bacterium]
MHSQLFRALHTSDYCETSKLILDIFFSIRAEFTGGVKVASIIVDLKVREVVLGESKSIFTTPEAKFF